MRLASCAAFVLLGLSLSGCKKREAPADPPVAAPGSALTTPPPIDRSAAPLDPVRVETAKGSRDALDVMSRSIQCPQTLPSTFTRFCTAAQEFESGTAAELPEGDTILLGVGAVIEPGPPTVGTLGTEIPLILRLHRTGSVVSAKQTVLREPSDSDALPVVAARIGKTLDGKWDHVDVPAAFKPQFDSLATAQLEPLEVASNSYWPTEHERLELRRANNRWIGVGSPEGPAGRHVILLFVEHHKVLGPKEKSPQTITVLRL